MKIEILLYLLKVNGIFLVLYLVYAIGFSRLTFHRLNRTVLISMLPLSLLLPFIQWGNFAFVPGAETALPELFDDFGGMGERTQSLVSSSMEWNIINISWLVYGLVLLFFLVKLVLNYFCLIRIKKLSTRWHDERFSFFVADVPSVFSFFSWIFVPNNYDLALNSDIIEHEKQHARAFHSLDLIATELFIAFCWFNPVVYLFRSSLKAVHEFQVDSRILKNKHKTYDYLELILNNLDYSVKTSLFCNNFYGSTIKKRINMMTKSKSPKWKTLRYLGFLPLMMLITMSFSVTETVNNNIPDIYPIKTEDFGLTSEYGARIDPITKQKGYHYGMDFSAKTGTPVVATAAGMVIKVVFLEKTYGRLVVIDHGNGFITRYAQLNDFAVKEGDRLEKGALVGYVGQSGRATGPHLHYEVLKDGENVNPAEYMPEK